MSSCPCGSDRPYSQCCEPIHLDHSMATVPEQLMRARYCAHVLKLIDFIIATYHPSCKAEQEIEGIESSASLDWQRLEVITAPSPQGAEGFVEFKAFLQEDNVEHCMHERSRFIKENERWYYIDGVFPEDKATKLGRNDPCFCGSGKKFKRCCGK